MIEKIKSRRSCRSYTDKQVSEEDLNQIVECGLLAPSGMNTQGIHFCVITSKEVLAQLEALMSRPFFYNAPALIVVYSEPDNRYALQDGSCAMAQMYLAAHALGLGSCWINQLKDVENDSNYKELFENLGLTNKIIIGSLSVGYSSTAPKPRELNRKRVRYIK